MKRYYVIPICLILFSCLFPFSLSSYVGDYNEPIGFRDLKWGRHISELDDMVLYQESGSQIVCLRKNENLKIGEATVDKIAYYFSKARFCGVIVLFHNDTNAKLLKKFLFDSYGVILPEKLESVDKYFWLGKNVGIAFTYDKVSKKGDLFYRYRPIGEK